ncbi:hypothetical protein KMW28_06575 [Flammeovirga yaeyamensis]|uniref:Uncharacterized protein n=1 Tax=Flammeovirga yaeyamensis TaxID=367791 RepID=A0AAX1N7Q9_9BACT|nr:hypothetical protein [Flammeovirga yaeyamensis]MBB3697838.1 hypothetical protein [Flammeovirga yaeyamensis]NMF35806.1 hypothetical protein [Flammeovirga yaeyamensis]QWG03242.1 hypothetical protein KMW28_06575 [Flammeovirga yaeyamensis]
MKNLLLIILIALSSIAYAQVDKTKEIKLYKELYTGMTGEEVENYLRNSLKSNREVNGDFKIKFLDEDTYLLPIYENHKLVKVQIIFKNGDIEGIQTSLRYIEKAFLNADNWKRVKNDKFKWLFYKELDKVINGKNQISVYSLGIYHDEIGHRWHGIVYIAPRMEEPDQLDEEMVNKKKGMISSDL